MDFVSKIALCHKGSQHRTKFKLIDIFGDANQVNSSNFNGMILKFWEKFNHPSSHVYKFDDMFAESHGLVLCRLQAGSRYMFKFIPILLSVKGDEIVRPCDPQSNDTVTLRNSCCQI